MGEQLTFDLTTRTALGRDDFFVSPSNQTALASLEAFANGPFGKLILTGPKGAGKTHLTHVWAEITGAKVLSATALTTSPIDNLASLPFLAIEDVDHIAGSSAHEEALFHLHNLSLANGARLLMTAKGAPSHWGIELADLKSRMEGTMLVTLTRPDDALLGAVMMKLFADRQLAVPVTLLPYLLDRMERNFAAAQDLVAALDAQALSEGRAVTRALAAKVLDKRASSNS